MTTLLVDVGNTRCKWALWDDGFGHTGVVEHPASADARRWRMARVASNALICSVAADVHLEPVIDALEHSGLKVTLAQTGHEHAGVRCAYPEPSRLGVDRWMAVLAASRLRPLPVLVVDAGTACTIDAVDRDGHHAGGFIIPGLDMMQEALTSRTAQIRVDAPKALDEAFGTSTSEAVRNGALLAATGAVERATKWLAILCDTGIEAITVVFTGGNGLVIARALGREKDFRDSFVLEGLAIYAGLAP